MAKTPRDHLEEAEEAKSLMVPMAVRNIKGLHIVTGFTHRRLMVSIDVCLLIERFIMAIFEANPGRALRLVDHLRGKRLSRFPWRHRCEVREDVDELIYAMRKGGYWAE